MIPNTDAEGIAAAAHAAEAAGDFDLALTHWAEHRARFPMRAAGYLGGIATARAAGQRALARQLIVEGARRHPDRAELVEMADELPPKARALAERQLTATLLDDLKDRRAKGDTLLDAALAPTQRRHPTKAVLSTALLQVEALEARLPGRPDIRAACLRLLRGLQRLPEARARGEAWRADHPDDIAFVLLTADIAENAGDVAAALAIVQDLRTRVGPHPAVDAALMSLAARLPDAGIDAVCARALADHPKNPMVLREWAVLAQRGGDWEEGLRRWEEADRIVPKNKLIHGGLTACRLQLAMDRSVDTTDLAKFFGSFSSLGGTFGGCELGMMQRRHGSNALGLFRWSNIAVKDLVRGLDANFAGLGTPETTELTTNRGKNGLEEYMLQDRAYNSSSHTMIYSKDAPREKVREQSMRRLGYLRDGLLDQLRTPTKIFVYKFVASLRESENAIREIWAAIRRHGPVRLLCIVVADREGQRGTIVTLEDGLHVGFLGHVMGEAGHAGDEFFDELGWKGVCSAVLDANRKAELAKDASAITRTSGSMQAA